MHITLQLLSESGDELGRLRLQTVAVAAPGMETTRPDLGAQMAQLNERLVLALAQEGMTPILDPVGVRIAVSRGLLSPVGDEALIPLPVRVLGDADVVGKADYPSVVSSITAVSSIPTPNQADARADLWDDLFSLNADTPDAGESSPLGKISSSNQTDTRWQKPDRTSPDQKSTDHRSTNQRSGSPQFRNNDWDDWEQLEKHGEDYK